MLFTTIAMVAGIAGACSGEPEEPPAAASSAAAPSPTVTTATSPSPTPEPSPSDQKTEEVDVDALDAKDFTVVQEYRVSTSWDDAVEKYGADAVYIAALRSEAEVLLEADPELFEPALKYVPIATGTCEALDQGGTLDEGWRAIADQIGYVEEEDPMHLIADFFQSALVNAIPAYCPEHQDEADAYEKSNR